MVPVACHGESGGPPVRPFPNRSFRLVRIGLACLLAGLGALALPAHAEGLYRCIGSSGETVFTSHADGYRDCHHLDVEPQRHLNPGAVASVPRHAPRPGGPTVVSGDTGGPAVGVRASTASTGPAPRSPRAGRVLSGAVYRVRHGDGTVEYTNVPPAGGTGRNVTRLFTYIDTCVACDVHSTIDWWHVPLNLTAYADAIRRASSDFGVNEALLRAIIHAESAYNPNAMSMKGAQGLMQLMPATASDMGVMDAFNATQNIRGGARYLAELLKNFKGNADLAAAAYNAGPAAVQKYAGIPPYPETEVYVQRVDTLRKRYAAALGRTPLAER